MGLYKRGKVWWMCISHNGRQVRKSTETGSKKLAEQIYFKVNTDLAQGKWLDIPDTGNAENNKSVADLIEKYMAEHAAIKKTASSYNRDKVSLKSLLPFWGEYNLKEVTPKLINIYKIKRYKDGVKPGTINRELTVLKTAFNLAVKEWEWCKDNPVSKVKMEKENNTRDRWLSGEEEKRLLKVCPIWLKEIVIFALNTGLRQEEILSIKWDHVDFHRKTVVLHQTKNKKKNTIPLNSIAFGLLQNKKITADNECEWVFPSMTKTKITGVNLSRTFKSNLKKTGITDFRFHDLRHTFATRLVQAGIDLYSVQRLLGHKTPVMTQRYAHHCTDSLRRCVTVLE